VRLQRVSGCRAKLAAKSEKYQMIKSKTFGGKQGLGQRRSKKREVIAASTPSRDVSFYIKTD
jgi:hypothetical protein